MTDAQHLGAGPARLRGKRGTEFAGCPAWWGRSPARWPGRSYGIGLANVHDYTAQLSWMLEQGAMPPAREWPGRLHDCLLMLAGERARRDESKRKHAERMAKQRSLEASG